MRREVLSYLMVVNNLCFFAISHRARTKEKEGLIGLGLLAVARNGKGQFEVPCIISECVRGVLGS